MAQADGRRNFFQRAFQLTVEGVNAARFGIAEHVVQHGVGVVHGMVEAEVFGRFRAVEKRGRHEREAFRHHHRVHALEAACEPFVLRDKLVELFRQRAFTARFPENILFEGEKIVREVVEHRQRELLPADLQHEAELLAPRRIEGGIAEGDGRLNKTADLGHRSTKVKKSA